jgi:hypothetical protein
VEGDEVENGGESIAGSLEDCQSMFGVGKTGRPVASGVSVCESLLW